MSKCIVVGAGDLTVGKIDVAEDDYIIAVDGGLNYCGLLGLEPNLIVGDFDSVGADGMVLIDSLEQQVPDLVIRLNPIKDDTDMLFAIKHAVEMGYKDFRIYAATGGRFDHTFANIQTLLYLKNNDAVGYLIDGAGMTFVMKNESVQFKAELEGYLSVFSLIRESKGVTMKGLKYIMENDVITNDFPIGISNEFIGQEAEITVEDGELVCIVQYVVD